jgi:hypothetical protein
VNTYTGPSLFLSDGANVGSDHMYGSTPDTSFIVIKTSYLPTTPVPVLGLPGQIDITQNIWEVYYENDINLDAYTGLVMFRGVYSYTDSGDDDNPSLSNPKLNFTSLAGNASERGVNIEGSIVQFGDGTTSQMFISGNADNTYINLHNNGILGFDYNGTTTLNTAIGGGQYFGSLSTPGIGDIVITGNASNANHVIFTQGEYYNGLTQIDAGTTLQLGDGTQGDASGTPGQVGYYNSSGGNSSLLTADSANGLSTDRITDNGTLIVDNTVGAVDGITAVSLSNISGSGSLQQIGNLPLTLLANTTYTGATTIGTGSTLYLGTNSSGVAGSLCVQQRCRPDRYRCHAGYLPGECGDIAGSQRCSWKHRCSRQSCLDRGHRGLHGVCWRHHGWRHRRWQCRQSDQDRQRHAGVERCQYLHRWHHDQWRHAAARYGQQQR